MLFRMYHIGLIHEGIKTATRRNWKKRMVKVGGRYKMKTQLFSHISYGGIEVKKVYQQKLGDMTEEDAKKEGGYTLEEFRQVWKEINGSWDDDLKVWVVEFEAVETL